MVAPSIPVLSDLGDNHNDQCQPSPSLCISRDKNTNQYADSMSSQTPQAQLDHALEQPTPRTPPSYESETRQGSISLEDRVLELESKLATLSRLLSHSMKRNEDSTTVRLFFSNFKVDLQSCRGPSIT